MIKTFSKSDIGKKRKINQDAIFTSEKSVGNLPNLFLVADGMGGANAGDYASRIALETVIAKVEKNQNTDCLKILQDAISSANANVLKKAGEKPEYEGMGTTLVAACCEGEELFVANVGDSRLYIVGPRKIRQITRDHSWVEEMVLRGGLARDAARNHPDKNIITRAVGAADTVEPDFFRVELSEGELVLLCTDGLTNMLDDEQIRMIVMEAGDLVEKTERLIAAANEAGGKDNISVILVDPGI